MGVVDFQLAEILLIGIINADKDNSFTIPATLDKKQGEGFLEEWVLLGDADVVRAYLDTISNSHRGGFLQDSDELDYGQHIGDHVGVPGKVEIKIAADGDFEESTEAHSKDQIKRWRTNPNNVYGEKAHNVAGSLIGARHRLEDNFIFFTGSKAKVKLPQFVISHSPAACQASEEHTMLVVSRAVIYAHKEGYVSDWLFREHLAMSEKGLAEIRSGAIVTTPIDLAVKAGV